MIRAIALLFIGLWVVTVVVAEENLISFQQDVVFMEKLPEEIPIREPIALQDSLADDVTIESVSEDEIHANRNNHLYYLPSCEGYQQVNSAELVPFVSEEIATESGYQRAESCS